MKYSGKFFVSIRNFMLVCTLGLFFTFSVVGVSLADSADDHTTQVGIGFTGEEEPNVPELPVVPPKQVLSSTNVHSSLASTGWVPINFWIFCVALFMAGLVAWLRSFIKKY